MAKNKKGGNKVIDNKAAVGVPKVPDLAKSRVVRKQVSVLARLTNWQKKSAKTDWVIGEYLDNC